MSASPSRPTATGSCGVDLELEARPLQHAAEASVGADGPEGHELGDPPGAAKVCHEDAQLTGVEMRVACPRLESVASDTGCSRR